MPPSWVAIIALTVALALAGLGLKHELKANTELDDRVKAISLELEKNKADQKAVSQIDTSYQQELNNAKLENEVLRNSLRTGTKRLSVPAHCLSNTSTTPGSPVTESRAELNPVDADRIISITQRGDDAIRQLGKLQEYVEKVCLRL